jgi:hypothetical protein
MQKVVNTKKRKKKKKKKKKKEKNLVRDGNLSIQIE